MRWAWEGVFSMEIPEGWKVSEAGSLIEVAPPDPVGAAHISALRRTRVGGIAKGEAALLATDFAAKQGALGAIPSEICDKQQCSARLNFQTADDRGPYYWHVETRVWNGRALICSYTHDGKHETAKREAVTMFSSIQTTWRQGLISGRCA